MEKSIEQQILELSDADTVIFSKRLTDVLHDDSWIAQRGIQKSNTRMAARLLYAEMYLGDFSHLKY